MIEKIVIGIIIKLLEMLFGRITKEVAKSEAERKQAEERKETNDHNEAAYKDAKSREERIKAALDLLNRHKLRKGP